jgi:hypothetical protein
MPSSRVFPSAAAGHRVAGFGPRRANDDVSERWLMRRCRHNAFAEGSGGDIPPTQSSRKGA